MRTPIMWGLLALLTFGTSTLPVTTAFGQEESEPGADAAGSEPGERNEPRDRPRGEADRPRPRDGDRRGPRRLGAPPLMRALDADRDGELSAEEVAQAVAAIRKLDRNEDGIIDREELRPQPPVRGDRDHGPRGDRPAGDRPPREGDRPVRDGARSEGEADRRPREGDGRGFRGEADYGRSEEGGPGPRADRGRGSRGGRERGASGRGFGGRQGGAERFADRLMESDADGDGKLTRAELLKAIQSLRPDGTREGRGGRSGGNDRDRDSARPPRPE